MGCCSSSEAEEVTETELPMPEAGRSMHVYLKKQGTFKTDYDVFDISDGEPGQIWMLVDAVGDTFSGMKYYLKYRQAGEEEFTVLGAAEIHGSDEEFSWKITDEDVDIDIGFDSDSDDFSVDEVDFFDLEVAEEKKLKAKWKLKKECNLYSDREMTEKIGELKVKAKGKYKRKTTETSKWVEYFDDEGHEQKRQEIETEVKYETKLKKFNYKFKIHDTKINLEVEKGPEGGSYSSGAKLEWTGSTSEEGDELFKIIGDGRNCYIRTEEDADPNSTLLAAFACACQFHPGDLQRAVEIMCQNNIEADGRDSDES